MDVEYNLQWLFANILCEEDAVKLFQKFNIIPNKKLCPRKHQMKIMKTNDTVSWVCSKNMCNNKISVRKNTWLEGTVIPLKKIIIFIYSWSQEYSSIKYCEKESGISHCTAVNWKSYCYEVCEYWLRQQEDVGLGGPGKIVEIDESEFVCRKYNKGKYIENQWVFGAIQRDNKKLLLFPVEKRDSVTLVPLIKKYILPGTVIYSDSLEAYHGLGNEGYIHHQVNHAREFVTEEGIHTQTIERVWNDAKSWVLRAGNRKENYPKYLAKYLFCRTYHPSERFHFFLKSAAQLYPHPYKLKNPDKGKKSQQHAKIAANTVNKENSSMIETDEVLSLIEEMVSLRQGDKFDVIGKNVTSKLKKFPSNIRIVAEKLIGDILFQAQLGVLNVH